ncbi:cupin domain-containing protein [Lactiplantibacillus pentosus]|uniref:cupin domain-containing protein n=1 Tax=Lactiplantibacillus pentosus TaxID=1589 RepID=UPI0021A3776B|nr:cupin domain-containing protein [Lactiplantibacillus pentosus]MCT3065037.1 cupin domain-containing protein [Lactiplantibacillus pentosus]
MSLIDKIDHAKVLKLTDQIPLDEDQVNSRTLVQRDDLSMTLFSIATDQEIGGHSAKGDAMVNVLSGIAEVTIEETVYRLTAGQSIVIPKDARHSLYAVEGFQMLLVVVKPA